MARKNTNVYVPYINQDASVGFDNKSNPSDVLGSDNCGIQILWTGATLNGQIKVYTSNDETANPKMGIPVINWSALDVGGAVVVDNTNSDIIITLTFVPFKWIAVEWVNISGTGTMTIQISTKQAGG